jgi:hypothetical protein
MLMPLSGRKQWPVVEVLWPGMKLVRIVAEQGMMAIETDCLNLKNALRCSDWDVGMLLLERSKFSYPDHLMI